MPATRPAKPITRQEIKRLLRQRSNVSSADSSGGSSSSTELEDTGVTAGTYGSATESATITVDAKGRITSAANTTITGGSSVTSVFTRTGAVVAVAGDYTADEVDYDNSGSGLTATDVQAAIDELETLTTAASLAYFVGASGAMDATINTDAAATKGVRFTPRVDITVDAVWAFIDQAATGDNYRAIIASLSDSTNTATVGTVIGTSPTQSNGLTTTQIDRFEFSSPLSLTAGTVYFAGVYFDQASGTAVCRLGGNSTTRHNPRMHAPVAQHGRFNYNTVGLTGGQSPTTALNDDNFTIALEGSYAP